jgi:hypothetical protein
MNFVDLQVRVHGGDGLVANFGSAILMTVAKTPEHFQLLDDLLSTVASGLENTAIAPGRRLARQVVRLIAGSEPEEVPPFCLLAAVDNGVAVILQGDLDVEVSGPEGKERLSGRKVSTWVDQIVDLPFDRLVVAPSAQVLAEPDERSDLRMGIVPCGGLSLLPRASAPFVRPTPAAAAPDRPPVGVAVPPAAMMEDTVIEAPPKPPPRAEGPTEFEPVADFVSVSLDEGGPAEEQPPLPIVGEEAPVAEEEVDEGVLVQGIVCSRGHFGDPSSAYCASCGISMVQQTHNLVQGPRPPLGVAVLDDGSTYVLDGDYVIGREPEDDPEVRARRALPLVLADPERTVSRVHARIELGGWDVNVSDADSSNGTHVAQPGATEWTRLTPHETVTIRPGARLLVGDRTLIFDSHHRN